MIGIEKITDENNRRNAILDAPYDPIIGIGGPLERQQVYFSDWESPMYFPKEMMNVREIDFLTNFHAIHDAAAYLKVSYDDLMLTITKLRFKCDFEFYSATAIQILNKDTFQFVPFVLRGAQRILLAVLEAMRLAGAPIRIVLLKARQWGGSTLVQIYMMWIQQVHKHNWHLAVCAQDDSAAKNIYGMYSNAAEYYPSELGTITLRPYQRSKNRICVETGGIIGIGSVNNPKQFRSFNYAMIHLSEVGIWPDTEKISADELIASLKETVPDVPYSMIVEESTAKGLNYFHDSWQRAESGTTRNKAVFVPWHKIDRCRIPLDVPVPEFVSTMSKYDWFMWEEGATLEGINWYNKHKADRYQQAEKEHSSFSETQMKQENPTTVEEAFQSAGEKRFDPLYIKVMEQDCCPPEFIGDVYADATQGENAFDNIEFRQQAKGKLWIWEFPDTSIEVSDRYVGFADIGGVWRGADYSSLVVLDRYWMTEQGDPVVVAVWHGHADKDLFGWIAAQICKKYNNALLAYETNTYDKDKRRDDHFLTVVEEIADVYPNMYIRNRPEKVGSDFVPIYGFHTNVKTKPAMIDALHAASRERYRQINEGASDGYSLIVRDKRLINEMNWYEKKEDGTLGAMQGKNDDLVIVHAGAYYIATKQMPLPQVIERNRSTHRRLPKSEASF
jgi:hypothetical protein